MPPNGPKPPAAAGPAAPLRDLTAPPPAVTASPAAEGPSASTYRGSTATYPVPAYGSTTTELSWLRFLGVPLSMRSWLSLTIIHAERVLGYLVNLRAENLIPAVQEALHRISEHLELIVHNFQSPFLDNASLLHLGLERLQNSLFALFRFSANSPSVLVARINIKMTDANKVDPSGRLGTAFKYAVEEWLKGEYGRRQVSHIRGGTSFLVTDIPFHRIQDSFGRLGREVLIILRPRPKTPSSLTSLETNSHLSLRIR